MKKIFWMILAVVGLVILPTSCGTDDLTKYKDSELTPKEHQARINQMGKDFTGGINPQDQEKMVSTISVFGSTYVENESFATTFVNPLTNSNVLTSDAQTVTKFYSNLSKTVVEAVKTRNADCLKNLSLTKAESLTFLFYDYLRLIDGKYSYTEQDGWKRIGEYEDAIEMTFPVGTYSCVLTLACSGTSSFTYSPMTISFPSQIELKYSVDGVQQFALVFKNSISSDQKDIAASITLSVIGDLQFSLSADLKDASLDFKGSFKVGKNELAGAKIGIKGSGLTTLSTYDNPSKAIIVDHFKTFHLGLLFMSLRLEADGDIATIIQTLENNPTISPEQRVDLINTNIAFKIYYTDTKEYIGQIKIKYIDSAKTEIFTPVITFADGTEMTFEEFFDEATFASFLTSLENVIQEYLSMIDPS